MIHAVPIGSGALVAECGQQLDGWNHTGHYRPLLAINDEVCPSCDPHARRVEFEATPAPCPVCVDLSARIASALQALTWDLPHDNRVETARRHLRGEA